MVELLFVVGVMQVDGILFDIGVSSFQFDDVGCGFLYYIEVLFDMCMSQSGEFVVDVVNDFDEIEFVVLIYEYGEEWYLCCIVCFIVQVWEKVFIEIMVQFVEIIKWVYLGFFKGIYLVWCIFQVLWIYVNDEFGVLCDGLSVVEGFFVLGGWLVVISFYLFEDCIVKCFLFGSDVFILFIKWFIVVVESEQVDNFCVCSVKL